MKKRLIAASVTWIIAMAQGLMMLWASGLPFPSNDIAVLIGTWFVLSDLAAVVVALMTEDEP